MSVECLRIKDRRPLEGVVGLPVFQANYVCVYFPGNRYVGLQAPCPVPPGGPASEPTKQVDILQIDSMPDSDDDRPARPGPDASNAEWAEWMEADFTAALTESLEEIIEAGGVGAEGVEEAVSDADDEAHDDADS